MAKKMGFSNKLSNDLVLNTADGALEIFKTNKNLEKLILDVASPGGTTEAALKILMKKDGLWGYQSLIFSKLFLFPELYQLI